jgi:hypothetical protein
MKARNKNAMDYEDANRPLREFIRTDFKKCVVVAR